MTIYKSLYFLDMESLILMEIHSVKRSKAGNFYDIILKEKNGAKGLSIPVGTYEGQMLLLFLEKKQILRPMTFELMLDIFSHFRLNVKEIVIVDFVDGSYRALVTISNADGLEQKFDSRSSDAINLAVREAVPLYVENRVLEEVGFNISEALIDGENEFILQNLKELLQEAVKNQDEEMQSILENEISNLKRKK